MGFPVLGAYHLGGYRLPGLGLLQSTQVVAGGARLMEGEPIIEARDLHKEFVLQMQRASLKGLVLSGRRRTKQLIKALNGIDLTIMPGEAVALVGRNGSGKSTFLSLVGKIYLPTSGSLEV